MAERNGNIDGIATFLIGGAFGFMLFCIAFT